LESQIQELTNLIKKQKEKVVNAYLIFHSKKELAKDLINSYLEYTNSKKRELPGIRKYKKEYDKLYDELYEKLNESDELIQKIDIITKDCEELIT
jgi:hypothetical protein